MVTKEWYSQESGTNLDDELKARIRDVDGMAAERFIKEIEEFLLVKYSMDYDFAGEVDENNEHQVNCFRKAVRYQIDYELINGSIRVDSGYDIDTGLKMLKSDLDKIGVSGTAHFWMRKGGMANLGGC